MSPSWAYVVPSRAMLSHLGPMFGPCWAMLGPSWAHLGSLLGPCCAYVDLCWAYVGLSWPLLRLCWAYVGLSVGPRYAYVGPMLGQLGGYVGHRFGICWRFWACVGEMLGRLCWKHLQRQLFTIFSAPPSKNCGKTDVFYPRTCFLCEVVGVEGPNKPNKAFFSPRKKLWNHAFFVPVILQWDHFWCYVDLVWGWTPHFTDCFGLLFRALYVDIYLYIHIYIYIYKYWARLLILQSCYWHTHVPVAFYRGNLMIGRSMPLDGSKMAGHIHFRSFQNTWIKTITRNKNN